MEWRDGATAAGAAIARTGIGGGGGGVGNLIGLAPSETLGA